MKRAVLGFLAGLLSLQLSAEPALRDTLREAWTARSSGPLSGGWESGSTGFAQAFLAYSLADASRIAPDRLVRLSQVEELLSPYLGWLQDYPRLQETHGKREPAWIRGEADQAALALLALIELDKAKPSPSRREQISQFAQGLVMLKHPNGKRFPFGAHTSFDSARLDSPAYAPAGEAKAPGAVWRPERSYQIKALVTASEYLGDKSWLESARSEALGMWAHLVTSGRWVWAFVPRPLGRSDILASAAAVDNLLSLEAATQQEAFALLAGLSAQHCLNSSPGSPEEQSAQTWVQQRIAGSRAKRWLGYSDLANPTSYQIMEAEQGKAVQKAFDTLDVRYPDGQAGSMVKVGRDQMFWMRFDIEREDDYFFYLVFLKSRLEGGLVSVMMRIDGDRIFQVNLGGASDPLVDMDFIDGPRPLRSGPHSFGIRFAGLLMTQPAVLDSVLAWPVVERRFLARPDGRRLLLLHNLSDQVARTTYPELDTWPPQVVNCLDGNGQPAALERQSDRRRRKEYLLLPPGGLAWLEW